MPRSAASAADWLSPSLAGKTALAELTADELSETLHAMLPWQLRRRLETEAPTHFAAPSGSSVPIDYAAEEGPKLAIRVQELFGLDRHPAIAGGRVPLVLELLSPAHRPVAAHPRPAGLLARQLCGGQSRDEGPLSAPSLAGRSAGGAAHPPRQAAPASRTVARTSQRAGAKRRPMTGSAQSGSLRPNDPAFR